MTILNKAEIEQEIGALLGSQEERKKRELQTTTTRRIPLTKAIRDYSNTIAKYFDDEAEMALQAAKEDAERFKNFADSIRTQGDAIASELAGLLDETVRKMQAET